MSEVGAPPEPRPVFETSCKPDIVARLRADSVLPPTAGEVFAWPKALLVEAAEAIEGLRESDARRLRLINEAKAERDEARARVAELVAVADAALRAIDDLVAQSHGVIGLHQNGDVAPWGELLAGGRYEDWLGAIEPLRQALRTAAIAAIPANATVAEGGEDAAR